MGVSMLSGRVGVRMGVCVSLIRVGFAVDVVVMPVAVSMGVDVRDGMMSVRMRMGLGKKKRYRRDEEHRRGEVRPTQGLVKKRCRPGHTEERRRR